MLVVLNGMLWDCDVVLLDTIGGTELDAAGVLCEVCQLDVIVCRRGDELDCEGDVVFPSKENEGKLKVVVRDGLPQD